LGRGYYSRIKKKKPFKTEQIFFFDEKKERRLSRRKTTKGGQRVSLYAFDLLSFESQRSVGSNRVISSNAEGGHLVRPSISPFLLEGILKKIYS